MTKYRVKRGDTLWHIAQQHYGKGSLWPLIDKANRLPKSHRILVGMNLNIPDLPVATPAGTPQSSPTGPKTYKPASTTTPGMAKPAPTSIASPLGDVSLPTVADAIAMEKALEVRFPAAKYTLEKQGPELKDPGLLYDTKITISGSVTVQKMGTTPKIEVKSSHILEGPDSIEYSLFVTRIFTPKLTIDREKRQVSLGFSTTIGKEDDEVEFSFDRGWGVNGRFMRQSYTREVKFGVLDGFAYTSSVTYEMELDQNWFQIAASTALAAVVVVGVVYVAAGSGIVVVEEVIVVGGRWALARAAGASAAALWGSIPWQQAQQAMEALAN